MHKVAIMTDTISGIPREMADELQIEVVPLHVILDGVSYLDTEVDKSRLYQRLAQRDTLPTTSAPTAVQFLRTYHKLSQTAEAIVHICYTSWIGMGHKQAVTARRMASQELPGTRIALVNSQTEHGAQLLCVLEAARAAAEGMSFAAIVRRLNRLIPRLNLLYILDTVYYLGRGGRMGSASAWTDTPLGLKSIVELDASTRGAMTPVTRARSKARAMGRAVDIVAKRNKGRNLHVVVSHDDAPADAEDLKQRLISQLPVKEIHVTGVSPVTIVHNGPGAIRLGWYSED
jgi:DegV family protein with EDD domain